MNTSPSTMIAEPVMRMPAWRTVSPMNFSTRPFSTFSSTRQQKSEAMPNDLSEATTFIAACSARDELPELSG